MYVKFASLFVLLVLTLVIASGCAAIPVSSTSSGTGTPGVPVIREETAVPPSDTPPVEPTVVDASPMAATPAPTAAATATPAATVASTATAGVTVTVTATATLETPAAPAPAVEHYQGPNPYRATPMFDVAYDPAVWEYVADDGSGRQSQLKHRTDAGCAIWLRAGPVDAKRVADVYLADRAWTLAQVQPKVIQYVAPQDDFAWIFGVILPEEYTGMANSNCQDAAEQVINTFKVVTE